MIVVLQQIVDVLQAVVGKVLLAVVGDGQVPAHGMRVKAVSVYVDNPRGRLGKVVPVLFAPLIVLCLLYTSDAADDA